MDLGHIVMETIKEWSNLSSQKITVAAASRKFSADANAYLVRPVKTLL